MIRIDTPPPHPLFAGFEYTESHFSIDNSYKTSESSKHGFTPLHYTVTYSSKVSKGTMTVHVYLDKQGQYCYSQAKLTNDKNKSTELKINKETEELLKNNIATSMGLLKHLFEERETRYHNAKTLADGLEVELSMLSQNFESQTSRIAYMTKAKTFIETINTLNLYTEIQDLRGKRVLKQLDYFENLFNNIQQAKTKINLQESSSTTSSAAKETPGTENPSALAEKPQTETTPGAENPQASTEKPQIEERLDPLYQSIVENLEKLNKQLSEKIPYSLDNIKAIQ